VVDGLCPIPEASTVLEVEAGAAGHADDVNVLAAGARYGWPSRSAGSRPPTATLPTSYRGPGGCAVLDGRLWITSLDGRALLSAPLRRTASGVAVGTFGHGLVNRYGRLRTVVAADDGALWLTTSNRDGHGHPIATDERVIRYVPSAGGGAQSPV
jgi:glucose/arabinose dehydrogenase